MAVSGCKPQHAKLVLARVRTLVEVAKWKRLADLTEDSLLRALEELGRTRTKAMRKGYEGRGQQTRGHYIAATKQFAHWLVATQRTLRNPFARVRRPKAIREPRQARRVPSDEEVGRLLAYLEGELEAKPGTICRVPPRGRRLMYLLAAATGFRAGELRSLTWRMFDLDKGAVTCRTAYSKDQKQATFPLPVWLADEFREWHAQGGALWSHLKIRQPGRGMRRDLRAAGIPYEVELPEGKAFWDFHSWRHWFVSWMARQPGISPKVLMALSRHSDPRLTMSVYAKVRDEDVGEQLRRVEVPGRTHGRTESGDGGVHRDTAEQWWQERSGWPEG